MSRLKIIIASPTERAGCSVTQILSEFTDLDVVQNVTTLEKLVLATKGEPIDIVLLSEKFSIEPEFDVVISLLQDRDIRWFILSGRQRSRDPQPNRRAMADIFEFNPAAPARALAQQIRSVARNPQRPHDKNPAGSHPAPSAASSTSDRIILIGGSTGGVDCLIRILEKFGPHSPPAMIVQHTGAGYQPSLIKLLDRRSAAHVVAGTDGLLLKQGTVAIAASSEHHLQLSKSKPFRCICTAGPSVSGHRPSVDALYHSAVPLAKNVCAALLTGMGRDGAEGLLALRQNGAMTIAQNEQSSVVFGMPRVADEMGAVQKLMDINVIADFLHKAGDTRATLRGQTT